MKSNDLVTIVVNAGEWDESKHPRAEDGKFTDAGGGGSGGGFSASLDLEDFDGSEEARLGAQAFIDEMISGEHPLTSLDDDNHILIKSGRVTDSGVLLELDPGNVDLEDAKSAVRQFIEDMVQGGFPLASGKGDVPVGLKGGNVD